MSRSYTGGVDGVGGVSGVGVGVGGKMAHVLMMVTGVSQLVSVMMVSTR